MHGWKERNCVCITLDYTASSFKEIDDLIQTPPPLFTPKAIKRANDLTKPSTIKEMP